MIFCVSENWMYSDKVLEKPQNFYRQMPLHTEAFTQRSFYTQKLLHTDALYKDAFAQRSICEQTPLHTDAFTHRRFHTQKLLHRETFAQNSFYAKNFLSPQKTGKQVFELVFFFSVSCRFPSS
jgi:hypothetical protein